MNEATLHPAEPPAPRPWYRRRLWIWPVVLVALLVVYYLGGMAGCTGSTTIRISRSRARRRRAAARSVAVAADLIDREINTHRWVANDPFFMPGSLLDNMPNFQQGIIAGAVALRDRARRPDRPHPRLEPDRSATWTPPPACCRYPGTVWIFDLATSFAPTASSESQYRRAMAALRDYNQRLAEGQAMFETRADNLQATLDRIAADIGSSSAALDQQHRRARGLLAGFRRRRPVLRQQGPPLRLLPAAARARRSTSPRCIRRARPGRRLDARCWTASAPPRRSSPGSSSTATPDSQLLPSHLASQGFFLLRARTQLREITNILLK